MFDGRRFERGRAAPQKGQAGGSPRWRRVGMDIGADHTRRAGRRSRPGAGLDKEDPQAVDGDRNGRDIRDRSAMSHKKDSAGHGPVARGRALEEHIAGWIATVERTSHWTRRSDIHQRLMAEVEKIVIRATLEKVGFVQTEAADFLGINRNTLAKKIKQYGLSLPR
jgi:DNA-binding protein Fis